MMLKGITQMRLLSPPLREENFKDINLEISGALLLRLYSLMRNNRAIQLQRFLRQSIKLQRSIRRIKRPLIMQPALLPIK